MILDRCRRETSTPPPPPFYDASRAVTCSIEPVHQYSHTHSSIWLGWCQLNQRSVSKTFQPRSFLRLLESARYTPPISQLCKAKGVLRTVVAKSCLRTLDGKTGRNYQHYSTESLIDFRLGWIGWTIWRSSCIFGSVIAIGDFIWLVNNYLDLYISTHYCYLLIHLIVTFGLRVYLIGAAMRL